MIPDAPGKSTRWLLRVLPLLAAALLCCTGCQSLTAFSARPPLDEEPSIDGIRGPVERNLQAENWRARLAELKGSGVPFEGLEEFEAAEALYEAGEYRSAEKAFAHLAKSRRNAGKTWSSRWKKIFVSDSASEEPGMYGFGDPIEEDALFMLAECQFAQQRYSWSQDSYGMLLKEYPSTRHLDQVTRRLFTIARIWLNIPDEDPDEQHDVQLVSHTEEADTPRYDIPRGPSTWPVVPNLVDRTRPVFDTHGRALQALESIWQFDPTGPLADDALMLQATYYQMKGDNVEAARLYALVREQYPDSSHFVDAYLLGSYVTMASYSGAAYDSTALTEAKQLKETAVRLFPTLSDEQRQRLADELRRIEEAEVEREWETVQFYLRKNQPASVALHCNVILQRYPDSSYAKSAWEVLERQKAAPTSRWPRFGWPSRKPSADDEATDAAATEPTPESEASSDPEEESGGWLRGVRDRLLRADEPRQLQPIEPGRTTLDADDDAEPTGRVQL